MLYFATVSKIARLTKAGFSERHVLWGFEKMRRKLGLMLLLATVQPCVAQTLVNVIDDNGNELGQLHLTTEDSAKHFVFRPDSIVVQLDFFTGDVLSVLNKEFSFVVFQESNCQGQAYIIAQGAPTTFDWISAVPTNAPP